jgi:hypothetical protein
MNAEEVLAFADALRGYALKNERDLNAANLLVHNVLTRTLRAEAGAANQVTGSEELEAA